MTDRLAETKKVKITLQREVHESEIILTFKHLWLRSKLGVEREVDHYLVRRVKKKRGSYYKFSL